MEKEFVPYELVVKLKAIGFDDECFGAYHNENYLDLKSEEYDYSYAVKAPLFQQVFRWFREKYNVRQNIMDFIDDEVGIEWDYEIATIGTDIDENGNYKPLIDYSTNDENRKFKNYEEAELACLEKLIEIVEMKKEILTFKSE